MPAVFGGSPVARPDSYEEVQAAVVRARMREAAGVVRGELARVDAKASTLLALVGAALAVVASTLTGRHGLPVPAVVIAWTGAGCLGTATLLLLAALRPRLAGGFGFVAYARTAPAGLLDAFTAPGDVDQAGDLVLLSALTLAKYQRLRTAVDTTVTGLLLVAVSAVLAAVLGGVS